MLNTKNINTIRFFARIKKSPSGEDTTGGVISNCFGTLESSGSTIGSSSGNVVTTSESSSTHKYGSTGCGVILRGIPNTVFP